MFLCVSVSRKTDKFSRLFMYKSALTLSKVSLKFHFINLWFEVLIHVSLSIIVDVGYLSSKLRNFFSFSKIMNKLSKLKKIFVNF